MGLSNEDQVRLRAHLDATVKPMKCPLCAHRLWHVREVAKVEVGDPGGNVWDSQSLQFAALICANCGNTVFIHLGKPGAGILP
mgnify:FL=1